MAKEKDRDLIVFDGASAVIEGIDQEIDGASVAIEGIEDLELRTERISSTKD